MSTTVHHTSDTHSNKNINIKSQKQASDTAFRSGSDTSSISAYSESTSFGEAANTSTTASIKHDLIERVTNPTVSSKSDDGEDVTKSDEATTSKSKSGDGEDTANSDEAATSKTKSDYGEDATNSDEAATSKSKSDDGEDVTKSDEAATCKPGDGENTNNSDEAWMNPINRNPVLTNHSSKSVTLYRI